MYNWLRNRMAKRINLLLQTTKSPCEAKRRTPDYKIALWSKKTYDSPLQNRLLKQEDARLTTKSPRKAKGLTLANYKITLRSKMTYVWLQIVFWSKKTHASLLQNCLVKQKTYSSLLENRFFKQKDLHFLTTKSLCGAKGHTVASYKITLWSKKTYVPLQNRLLK